MDSTKRAIELKQQINALYQRKGEIEVALQREHVTQERAAAKRTLLVAELPDADEALTGYTHAEVDKLDGTLRLSCRVAEGLKNSFSRLADEIAGLEPELREIESRVQQEQRAKALADFRYQLEQSAHQAVQALDSARRNFAQLHLCAAAGIDRFAVDALRICELVFAEFQSKQSNLETRGLRRVNQGFQNTPQSGVFVQPMVGG